MRENLTIDIAELDASGPPVDSPRLEFYGTPVRLVLLVLAPSGRGSLPPKDKWREMVNLIVPNFSQVLDSHQPIFRQWEGQRSVRGFEHSFFQNMALPGNRGKGTPWCAVAGPFEENNQQCLVGLICCSDGPNSLSQITVKHSGQWLDTIRVRD